jgi:predicted nucleic acid-binding protein
LAILVDTSALLALLDRDAEHHEVASEFLIDSEPKRLLTHNYVVVETASLVRRRLGAAVLQGFVRDLLPAISTCWVVPADHDRALSSLVSAPRRRASFVDLVSFEVMRRLDVEDAFAFDPDFAAAGFRTLP